MGVVLFVREDLLKASHYKLITVAGHTRRGKWIDPYQANVLVSDDHDTDKVAAGQGSHYQKQAHKKLAAKVKDFHAMEPGAKATIILAQATKMQKEASQSAALSNWKKEALAGNNPKPSMWAAFYALDNAGRSALLAQVGSKVGDTDHLHAPSNPNLQPAQAPVNSAQAAIETVAHTDDLPHKVKDKLDGWATNGYVDRLQDAANDNGSSSAYSAYAKKLLAQFEPPAGPTVDTPVPADAKKTMDSMFANGNKTMLQAVADNNSANPHVAAYAQKLLERLESPAPAYSVKTAPVGGLGSEGALPLHAVIDFAAAEKLLGLAPGALEEDDSTTYTITNASGQTFSVYKHKGVLSVRTSGNNKSQESAQTLVYFLEKNAPVVPTAPAPLHTFTGDGLEAYVLEGQGGMKGQFVVALKDTDAGETVPTFVGYKTEAEAIKSAKAAAGIKEGPRDGDTKTENGKTYFLHGGKWHLTTGPGNSANAVAAATSDGDHAKHKAAVAAFETGSYYQKEALKKLKAEHGPAWHAMHPAKQHDLAQAKYQALQGAASQAAAVSGWKKHMLAGQVPTPSEVKAMAAFDTANPKKAVVVMNDVQAVIGLDKYVQLVTQAHAKAAKAAKTAPVPGNMTFEPVAKPAVVVTKDKPAAPPNNDAKAKLSPELQDFVMLFKFHGGPIAQGQSIDQMMDPEQIAAFKAATSDEKTTVAAAISFYGPHKLQLFMDWLQDYNAKAAAPQKVKVTSAVYNNDSLGHNKFWSVSTNGNEMMTTYGKIGTMGSTTVKQFQSPSSAVFAMNKLKAEKSKKGYWFAGGGTHVYKSTAGESATASAAATLLNVGKPAPSAKVAPATTAGWTHQDSDGSFSGAPSLTAESADGYTYYAAYDGDAYQVGIVDPQGNISEYEDFPYPEDAAAQMAILIDGNNAGLAHPTSTEIAKLGGSGPKDGDTKPGANGTTLVFKDGRWHTQAKPDAIAVPDFAFDKSVWGTRYTLVAAALKSAFEAGGAKAIKSLVIQKKDGNIRVKGLLVPNVGALSTGPGASFKPRQKLMYAYVKAMLESNAKGGAKVAFTTAPPTAAAPKAATPKPAAPKAAPPEPIKPAVIFTTEPGKPKVTPMDGWTQIGPQKGSNPGGKFKDKNGKEWYCKFPATEDHAKNELLASKLYLAAGVDAPSLRLVSQNGKVGIASKFVDGVTKVGAGIKSAPGAMEGFAVDAWLGNYDSVGTGFDNLLKTKDGKAVRIDVGGSILYRAQGAPKGDAYGDVVNEIDAMRDPAKNQYGAAVFSGITKDQLNNSVTLVLDIPDDVIQQLVEKFGPGTKQEKIALTAKLIARKKDLAKRFPDADLIANPPKPDPRHLPVEPSKLPKKLDFLNWKGQGQGLSGTAKVNEVNQKAVDEIYASAMAGDYVAFKKLQFHVVDKSTGAVSTGSSFGSHPSQHIKDFYSLVMDYMEVIANPAAKKQKVWETEDYSDITELSDAFKAHYYGVTVGQVPANQRLGYWISLGQADAAASFMPAKVEYISAADKAKGSASTKGMTAILKKWMAAVKTTGSANQPYRDGKEIDNSGLKTRDVLTDAYAHAVELTEGTRITKGMTMPDAMLQQMIALPDGHVFQNPGSMCCSKNEDWGWGGNTRLKIIYAKGAKALYNIGVGQYDGEGEITTVPGQRFMLLKKDMKSKPPEFTLLMLPPDETYVANIKPKATP